MNSRFGDGLQKWIMVGLVAVALCVAMPALAQEEQEPPAEPTVDEKAPPKIYREKTEISIEGKTEANGVLELMVEPRGEEPALVKVNVLAKTKAGKIVKDLAAQLEFALGDRYKVKKWGDERIYVSAKGSKVPPLAIDIGAQQLPGVAVRISKG